MSNAQQPCPVHGQPKKAVLYSESIVNDWLNEFAKDIGFTGFPHCAKFLVAKLNERALALDIETEVEIAPWVKRGPLGEVR